MRDYGLDMRLVEAVERWIEHGELPPESLGPPKLWDCWLQGILPTLADRAALAVSCAAQIAAQRTP